MRKPHRVRSNIAAQYPQHVTRMVLIGPMEPTWTLFEARLEALAERDPEGGDELVALRERKDMKNDPLALCRASAAIIQRRYYFDPTKMGDKEGDYCAVPPDAPARAELADRYTWESLGEYDVRPLLADLEMPVLIVEGSGDLPEGIHKATLEDVEVRFGKQGSVRRWTVERLRRVYELALSTRHMSRFIVFGSFVTAKPEPNDVDIVMLMDNEFDASILKGEAALLFDHAAAQSVFGASVFWVRRLAALGGEDDFVAGWQAKRDGTSRGIVEVIS